MYNYIVVCVINFTMITFILRDVWLLQLLLSKEFRLQIDTFWFICTSFATDALPSYNSWRKFQYAFPILAEIDRFRKWLQMNCGQIYAESADNSKLDRNWGIRGGGGGGLRLTMRWAIVAEY